MAMNVCRVARLLMITLCSRRQNADLKVLKEPAWEIPANFVHLEYTDLAGNSRQATQNIMDFVYFYYTKGCIENTRSF